MSANERFASHTRSASFALQLSDPMIRHLLAHAKTVELCAKYPWHRPAEVNFGTADDNATEWCDSTVRALARRGLVDVIPKEPPCCRHEVITLTTAGWLMVELLHEAGFEVDPRDVQGVRLHPDDRITLDWSHPDPSSTAVVPPDRRDYADADFLDAVRVRDTVRPRSGS